MSPVAQTFLQALIVVLGWVVVHRLSAARDGRKLRIEVTLRTIDGLSASLNALLELSRDYHASPRDVSREIRIKVALQDFSGSLRALRRVVVSDASQTVCERCITPLRQAITGAHFEDEHDVPLPLTDELVEGIAAEISKAKNALALLRNDQLTA